MPIINQIPKSNFSLVGNGFNTQTQQPAWGYIDATANLDPAVSRLQNTYSVDNNPMVRLKDFNKNGVTTVKGESTIDELDPRAPKLTPNLGVVSQVYKSLRGNQYKQLGPKDGRY